MLYTSQIRDTVLSLSANHHHELCIMGKEELCAKSCKWPCSISTRWVCKTYDLYLPIRRTKSLADNSCDQTLRAGHVGLFTNKRHVVFLSSQPAPTLTKSNHIYSIFLHTILHIRIYTTLIPQIPRHFKASDYRVHINQYVPQQITNLLPLAAILDLPFLILYICIIRLLFTGMHSIATNLLKSKPFYIVNIE